MPPLPRVRRRPSVDQRQGVPGLLRGRGRRPLPAVQPHGRLRVLRRPHEEVRRVQVGRKEIGIGVTVDGSASTKTNSFDINQ